MLRIKELINGWPRTKEQNPGLLIWFDSFCFNYIYIFVIIIHFTQQDKDLWKKDWHVGVSHLKINWCIGVCLLLKFWKSKKHQDYPQPHNPHLILLPGCLFNISIFQLRYIYIYICFVYSNSIIYVKFEFFLVFFQL